MKKNLFKRLLLTGIVLTMTVSLFPQIQVFADDTSGWINWLPVLAEEQYPLMKTDDGKEDQAEFSFVNDPIHSSDGNGAIKIERNVKGGINLRLDLTNNGSAAYLPKRENEVVKIASVNVWADEDAAGSTLASYAITETGKEFNCAYSNMETRTLTEGWQTLYFDVTQCETLNFWIWDSQSEYGVIYLDDFKLKYQGVNDVIDSFDNFTDDWNAPTVSYTLTQNTDKQFVKDGTGSIKVECKEITGESLWLTSKLLNLPNINGKLVPVFEGYTAKNFGFWVYNVDADVTFISISNDRKICVNTPGWHYVHWEFGKEWWQNTASSISQLVLTCHSPGTVYVDALTVEYEKNDEVIAERFTGASIWFGQTSASVIDYYGIDNANVRYDGAYVKEGLTSAQLTLAKGKKFPDQEIVTRDWSKGGMPAPADAQGNAPLKLGMWIYGNGNSQVQLAIAARTSTASGDVVTEPVSIDFEGWQQIWFTLPENTTSIFAIRWGNASGEDAVLYIDKMTYQYPEVVVKPANALVNGDEELDLADVKLNDTIGYNVEFEKDSSSAADMWIVVAAYDSEGRLLKAGMEIVAGEETGKIVKEAQITVDTDEVLQSIAKVKGFGWNSDALLPVLPSVATP